MVARVAASVPLGELGARHLLAITAAGAAAVLLVRHRPAWVVPRRLAEVLVVLVLLQPAVALYRPPPETAVADEPIDAGLADADCLWRWRGFALLVGDAPTPAA
jgi:hypothetical protein